MLTEQIRAAKDRVMFVAPGVSQAVATALVDAHQPTRSVAVILDADEEVCRIGYGDVDGFEYLMQHGDKIELRKHSGVRLGLLMVDKVVTIWSPTPRAVEGDRTPDQPNAIVLEGGIAEDGTVGDSVRTESLQPEIVDTTNPDGGTVTPSALSLAEQRHLSALLLPSAFSAISGSLARRPRNWVLLQLLTRASRDLLRRLFPVPQALNCWQ